MLVTVAPSPLAPHYTHDRFPARSGTTTRCLTEREISALYDQRRVAFAATEDKEILADFLHPADAADAGVGFGGIGMLRLLVAPLTPARHPQGVRLTRPLSEAVATAKASAEALIPTGHAVAFDLMKDWKARGSAGWEAGVTFDSFERLSQVRTSVAICTHDLAMSFYATIELSGEGGGRCAFEQLWAAETIAFLSIAAHFFKQSPATSLLHAELGLQGLENAVSHAVSQGRIFDDPASREQPTTTTWNGLRQARPRSPTSRSR